VFAAEPTFYPGSPLADRVFDFQQVHGGEAGHGASFDKWDEIFDSTIVRLIDRA
jgi:hypothetical protein